MPAKAAEGFEGEQVVIVEANDNKTAKAFDTEIVSCILSCLALGFLFVVYTTLYGETRYDGEV